MKNSLLAIFAKEFALRGLPATLIAVGALALSACWGPGTLLPRT